LLGHESVLMNQVRELSTWTHTEFFVPRVASDSGSPSRPGGVSWFTSLPADRNAPTARRTSHFLLGSSSRGGLGPGALSAGKPGLTVFNLPSCLASCLAHSRSSTKACGMDTDVNTLGKRDYLRTWKGRRPSSVTSRSSLICWG